MFAKLAKKCTVKPGKKFTRSHYSQAFLGSLSDTSFHNIIERRSQTAFQKSIEMSFLSQSWLSLMLGKKKEDLYSLTNFFDKEDSANQYLFQNLAYKFSDDNNNNPSDSKILLNVTKNPIPKKNPTDVMYKLSEVLKTSEFKFAFGGALALSHYAHPRATADIDMTIWSDTHKELMNVVSILHEIEPVEASATIFGRTLEKPQISMSYYVFEHYKRQSFLKFYWYGVKIKVFFPTYPFLKNTVQEHCISGLPHPNTLHEIPIISMECLIIFKLWFHRPKDLIDIENIIAIQGKESIDAVFVLEGLKMTLEGVDQAASQTGLASITTWTKSCQKYGLKL